MENTEKTKELFIKGEKGDVGVKAIDYTVPLKSLFCYDEDDTPTGYIDYEE